jgi:hypothetical protein
MDVTPLYILAGGLDAQADILRGRAHRIALARDHARWQSPAARRCRVDIDGLVADLLGTAGQAASAAARVRAHATAVARHH